MSTKYSPEELYKLNCDLERGMISAIIAPGAKASVEALLATVKQTITIRHMEASINQTRLKDNFSDYLSGHFDQRVAQAIDKHASQLLSLD